MKAALVILVLLLAGAIGAFMALGMRGESLQAADQRAHDKRAEAGATYIQRSREITEQAYEIVGDQRSKADECADLAMLAMAAMDGATWNGREPTRSRMGKVGQWKRAAGILHDRGVALTPLTEKLVREHSDAWHDDLDELRMPPERDKPKKTLDELAAGADEMTSSEVHRDAVNEAHQRQIYAERFTADRTIAQALLIERSLKNLDALPRSCESQASRDQYRLDQKLMNERSMQLLAFTP